jgi:small subunit ribosomal protein S20
MPTTKSAAKRLRQSTLRRTRNRSLKHDLRTRYKRVASTVSEGDVQEAATELRETAKKLDQAAAKGVIHRNAAARHKSRLSARIKAAKAKAAPKT